MPSFSVNVNVSPAAAVGAYGKPAGPVRVIVYVIDPAFSSLPAANSELNVAVTVSIVSLIVIRPVSVVSTGDSKLPSPD